MNFVAFDVETANADLASICQIGVVVFEQGKVSEVWESLINPEDYFDSTNVHIHGISVEDVANAPRFPAVFERLNKLLSGQIVVHHTGFDRVSLARVASKYQVDMIKCRWIDSAKVVRRTWSEFARKGYGLGNLTNTLGIKFKHHQASEDARATGEILIRAIDQSGKSLEEWISQQNKQHRLLTSEANPDGPLAGEVLVFTGALTMTRREAAEMAAKAGCQVSDGVTKATTIVVVGLQDIQRLASHEKSSKHRKAEELIAKGQTLRILTERDFESLLAMD